MSDWRSLDETDIVYRLQRRAEIRRQIPNRKSVQEGESDRIADLLEEAAKEIEEQRLEIVRLKKIRHPFAGMRLDRTN
jgi:hypothetical protein